MVEMPRSEMEWLYFMAHWAQVLCSTVATRLGGTNLSQGVIWGRAEV